MEEDISEKLEVKIEEVDIKHFNGGECNSMTEIFLNKENNKETNVEKFMENTSPQLSSSHHKISTKGQTKLGQKVKKHRSALCIQQKVEALDMLQSGKSYRAVGRYFNVNESTMRCIKKSEKAIREIYQSTPNTAYRVQRVRDKGMLKMEKELAVWISDNTKDGQILDYNVIREKAVSLYEGFRVELGCEGQESTFSASKGWFKGFQKRFLLNNDVQFTEHEKYTTVLEAFMLKGHLLEPQNETKKSNKKLIKRKKKNKSEIQSISMQSLLVIKEKMRDLREYVLKKDFNSNRALKSVQHFDEAFQPYMEELDEIMHTSSTINSENSFHFSSLGGEWSGSLQSQDVS